MRTLIFLLTASFLGCFFTVPADLLLDEDRDDCCVSADVHILIGESTAEGRGMQSDVNYGGFPNVRIWQDKSGNANDEYQVLQLSNNMGTTLPSTTFFGAEMSFAEKLQADQTCCPVYIIKYGRGGQTLCDYWLNGGAGQNLSTNGIAAALADLNGVHDSINVKSILWLQGINDSNDVPACYNDYYVNSVEFYNQLNTAIGSTPEWLVVQNHSSTGYAGNAVVQAAQAQFANDFGATLIDGSMWEISGDSIHYTSLGNIQKGMTWYNETM